MKINLAQWNEDRKLLENEIRETKKEMHQPWTMAVSEAQARLELLRIEATAMYVFRVRTRRPPNSDRPGHPLGKNQGHYDIENNTYVPNSVSQTLTGLLKEMRSRYELPAVEEPSVPGERTP